jgi:hypothetical protein
MIKFMTSPEAAPPLRKTYLEPARQIATELLVPCKNRIGTRNFRFVSESAFPIATMCRPQLLRVDEAAAVAG